jgi:hypothetical protein
MDCDNRKTIWNDLITIQDRRFLKHENSNTERTENKRFRNFANQNHPEFREWHHLLFSPQNYHFRLRIFERLQKPKITQYFNLKNN